MLPFLKKCFSNSLFQAVVLVALTALLTYGLFLPRLGFFYDDWYMLWSAASRGVASLIPLFSLDRPFMGVIYAGLYRLFGETIPDWHWAALLFRAAGALAFYWILNLAWPRKNKSLYALAAMLFVVFPGFLAQPHGATKINHLLGYGAALFSVAFTLKAAAPQAAVTEQKRGKVIFIVLALLAEALYLWIYEYMIGLELMRVALLFWIYGPGREGIIAGREKTLLVAKQTLLRYIPYLVVIGLFMFWRVFLFDSTRDATSMGGLARMYLADPGNMTLRLIFQVLKDFLSVSLFAWFVQPYQLISKAGPGPLLGAIGIAVLVVLIAAVYLRLVRRQEPGDEENQAALVMVITGALVSLAAVFPVVLSNRMLDLMNPYKGYGLHPSAGVIILLLGFLLMLKSNPRKALLLGLLALSVVTQVLNIQNWASTWEVEKNFWWQVAWRAPDITDYSMVMAYAPDGYAFQQDYEVWGPLNLIYRQRSEPWPLLQSEVLNADTAVEVFKKSFVEEPRVRDIYLPRRFGNLILFSQPSTQSCVHAIDGQMPAYSGSERLIVQKVGSYSDASLINPTAAPPVPPSAIFGPEPEHTWCYYYEQAALARQTGNWQRIGELYDQVKSAGYAAGDPAEYFVFIEGLVNLGRENEAVALNEAKIEPKSALQFNLCGSLSSAPTYPASFGYKKERIFVIVCDSLDR